MEATLKRFVVISLLCKVCMSSRNCMNLYINLYLIWICVDWKKCHCSTTEPESGVDVFL